MPKLQTTITNISSGIRCIGGLRTGVKSRLDVGESVTFDGTLEMGCVNKRVAETLLRDNNLSVVTAMSNDAVATNPVEEVPVAPAPPAPAPSTPPPPPSPAPVADETPTPAPVTDETPTPAPVADEPTPTEAEAASGEQPTHSRRRRGH